ncbi:NAD(P)-dependent oxidoreductase [Mucilaginibacter glaciei]|uniref:NAD(P)H-binding protein n=1 Tax=Mucilaginibacter glaciei TaxID=2772109 RepID=A0A926NSG0_9SPHI|nr:NAD(P)H-binding protein [Mucilaginibacter glaciei]MBD1394503.1 NAD(P)H-binding protein [Mucilaginibacter glaciei]
MNVLLLGGTGRTGKLIVKQLLDQGHTVHLIVRDKAKVNIAHASLTVFEGLTLDDNLLKEALHGCQAVVSALNISRKSEFPWSALRTPKTLMSDTISKIIAIAPQFDLRRVIVLSAWGTSDTRKDIPLWFKWLIENSNIKYGYMDHERQEHLLMQSGLQWTAIRPAALINSAAKKPVVVSLSNNQKLSLLISRAAVANFTVDILEQGKFICEAPAISW